MIIIVRAYNSSVIMMMIDVSWVLVECSSTDVVTSGIFLKDEWLRVRSACL